jgi:hypothetical protein
VTAGNDPRGHGAPYRAEAEKSDVHGRKLAAAAGTGQRFAMPCVAA